VLDRTGGGSANAEDANHYSAAIGAAGNRADDAARFSRSPWRAIGKIVITSKISGAEPGQSNAGGTVDAK
jgi:hypothetical protein